MITTKDRSNLDRHLKLAAQWLKKREAGWQSGMNSQQAYRIEQRLFPSISLLSDYAQDYLLEQWPSKPWPLKVALIAALQSNNSVVFEAALAKLAIMISKEKAFYLPTLWLANPQNLSSEKRQAFIDSDVPARMDDEDFHQCYWAEDTTRHIALQGSFTLPAWLKESNQLKYSERNALLRALILKEPGSTATLTTQLAAAPSTDDKWQWLTLTSDPIAGELFFSHCEQVPLHLPAAALNGSPYYLKRLLAAFSISALAQPAAEAVAAILAAPIDWKPVLTDTQTGEPIADAPSLPVVPTVPEFGEAVLLSGQPKDALNVAQWMLAQPAPLQGLAWFHLGQCLKTVLPNLSCHWTHSQWHLLKQNFATDSMVSHAA